MSVTPAQENVIFLSCISSIANRLKESNSKLASIELILDEYYNGGYTTIGELAGEARIDTLNLHRTYFKEC